MKFFSRIRCFASIMMILLTVSAGGCAPPDRWAVFDQDLQAKVRKESLRPMEIPEELEPRLKKEPTLEVPEQGPITLSVEQAVMLALQNNRDLRVRQTNPVIAGTFEQIERGTYDPELFAEFEYNRERANETSRSTREQFSVEGNESSAVVGLRQTLPTGTTVEATLDQERSISNRSPEQQIARAELSITQNLLRGFGPAVNLVSVQQAELDTLASVYELRGFTESLLADTEIAYWNYVLAGEEIAIFKQSLIVAKQQLDEVEQRIDVGLLPEIEAPAARAEAARREQALIEARSLLEERRLRLLRLINPDPSGELDNQIKVISDPRIKPKPITDLAERLQLAEQSRPDLNEARLRLKQNRLETIVTRNGLLPELDLFITLGKTGFADTFPDSFRELKGKTYDFTTGIRLSQFLGNRAAKARDVAARASREQAADAVSNLRQIVRLDVRLAVNEVERTRQQISASEVTRKLEEQTVWAEEKKFDVGAGTALLVAQAQRDLLASQIAEVRAIINYRIALVQLYLAEGSLLERRGVRLGVRESDR